MLVKSTPDVPKASKLGYLMQLQLFSVHWKNFLRLWFNQCDVTIGITSKTHKGEEAYLQLRAAGLEVIAPTFLAAFLS